MRPCRDIDVLSVIRGVLKSEARNEVLLLSRAVNTSDCELHDVATLFELNQKVLSGCSEHLIF